MLEHCPKREPSTQKFPIKFQHQKDPFFQRLVDEGLAKSLKESNFCGLACTNMALSTYILDDNRRLDILSKIGQKAKSLGLVREDGTMESDKEDEEKIYLDEVNAIFQREGLPFVLETKRIGSQQDVCDELEKGNLVQLILGLQDNTGHAILADKAYSDLKKDERLFRWLDPAISHEDFAINFSSSNDRFFKLPNFTGAIVSPVVYVFRKI